MRINGYGSFKDACSSHSGSNFHHDGYPTHSKKSLYYTTFLWLFITGDIRQRPGCLTGSIFTVENPSFSLSFFASTASANLIYGSTIWGCSEDIFSVSCLTFSHQNRGVGPSIVGVATESIIWNLIIHLYTAALPPFEWQHSENPQQWFYSLPFESLISLSCAVLSSWDGLHHQRVSRRRSLPKPEYGSYNPVQYLLMWPMRLITCAKLLNQGLLLRSVSLQWPETCLRPTLMGPVQRLPVMQPPTTETALADIRRLVRYSRRRQFACCHGVHVPGCSPR